MFVCGKGKHTTTSSGSSNLLIHWPLQGKWVKRRQKEILNS